VTSAAQSEVEGGQVTSGVCGQKDVTAHWLKVESAALSVFEGALP